MKEIRPHADDCLAGAIPYKMTYKNDVLIAECPNCEGKWELRGEMGEIKFSTML